MVILMTYFCRNIVVATVGGLAEWFWRRISLSTQRTANCCSRGHQLYTRGLLSKIRTIFHNILSYFAV